MDEKRSPIINEKNGSDKVCKPIADVVCTRLTDGASNVYDEINDLYQERLFCFDPFSDEEAIAKIEQAEAELNDYNKWITSERM